MEKKRSLIFVIKDKVKFLTFVDEAYYPGRRYGVFDSRQEMSKQSLAKILEKSETVHIYNCGFEKFLVDPSKNEENDIIAKVVVSDDIFSSLVVEELLEVK